MSEVIDSAKAKRLFLRAVELIVRSGALFLPRYLQLFFEYAHGANQALNKAIDEMLRSRKKPSLSELDFIFDLYLTDLPKNHNFVGMGERLDKEVRNAMDVVGGAISSTGKFGDLVEKAETLLANISDPERVRLVTKELVQVTRNMGRCNTEIHTQLTSSAEQIEQLHKELDKLKHESQTDSLTGAANRHCFDQTLVREFAKAARNDQLLSLCMIDVDHFKEFNDKFGHLAGDFALRFVASIFKHSIREYDLFARYGGEEFSLIMPNADLSTGVIVSNRIRETLSTKELIKRTTGENLGHVTVSIGVAQLREDDTPETLVERADIAMYAAKRAGRNCVKSETKEPINYVQVNEHVA